MNSRVLLCGAYKPYGSGDFVSRAPQYMELFKNQLTRFQDEAYLRMFHPTFGLHFLAANLDVPVTILEFPTWDEFVEELERYNYDVIGIGAIYPNFKKVRKMCGEIRRRRPNAKIVIGGHLSGVKDVAKLVDADEICQGEGIRWFRKYLGQEPASVIRHPVMFNSFGHRWMGVPLPGISSSLLVPSVGCPLGCKFCATSAMFGGAGSSIAFYESADEIFSLLYQIEQIRRNSGFFIMDENFLGRIEMQDRLMELIDKYNRKWSFFLFSSARHITSFGVNNMVRLGVNAVWVGLENADESYAHKLLGIDTYRMVKELRDNGIVVIGSTILGEDHHRPEDLEGVVETAIKHNCDLHQFVCLMPLPGTPLYRDVESQDRILSWEECPPEEIHGISMINYRHPYIKPEEALMHVQAAFERDFKVNGSSMIRTIGTALNRWNVQGRHPDRRIRERARGVGWLKHFGVAVAWALSRENPRDERAAQLVKRLEETFGLSARLTAPTLGRILRAAYRLELLRYSRGWNPEPQTLRWINRAAEGAGLGADRSDTKAIIWITPKPVDELA